MRSKSSTVVVAVLIALGAIVWAGTSFSRAHITPAESPKSETGPSSGAQVVDGYKQWTRVNPTPVTMQAAVSRLCDRPVIQKSNMKHENPHLDKFIIVYVNDIGRQAMMEQKAPRFPQNSVIVKEKLTTANSTSPELLTVMVKRENGYDAENGDWEYMVLDGSGKSVQASGKLPACQGCHRMVKSTDYVSRSYLPQEVRQKLR